MIKIRTLGDFKNTERFFNNSKTQLPDRIRSVFERYGQQGVEALSNYTPRDSGKTASSWSYEIYAWGIAFTNSNILTSGTPLAILIQYGHGTKGGGYVQGIDYINPALRPIFDEIADSAWKEVQNL